MSSRWIYPTLTAVFLAAAGCNKLVPVEGVLTLDGKPLAGATVIVVPQDEQPSRGGPRQANALTDAQGRFQLATGNRAGAQPARYKIIVSKKVLPPDVKPADPNNQQELMALASKMVESVPFIYSRPEDTRLAIEVPKGGKKDLTLALASISAAELRPFLEVIAWFSLVGRG